jgi:uncharacterized SAM-binding protein YcdF (DUF218 family)
MKLPIPAFPPVPSLTAEQIDALTRIIFLEPVDPAPCDCIYIFGGTHPGAWETGAQAYHAGLGKLVLVTGGVTMHSKTPHEAWPDPSLPTARGIAAHLVELGVPEEVITRDERPTHTGEEAACVKEWACARSIRSILCICKCYAAGRQLRTLRKHLPDEIALVPYPYDTNLGHGPLVTRENWMDRPESRSRVYSEYLRILAYGVLLPTEKPIPGLEEWEGEPAVATPPGTS